MCVVWPENALAPGRPVSQRGSRAAGPQFAAVGRSMIPWTWASLAPRLVTMFRLRPQLAPSSSVTDDVWIGRTFVTTSQPLFVSSPALRLTKVYPVDGGVGTLKITSEDFES